ncbi:MAG: helix-turn-helix domain-containing protein [Bacteroidales bacterium]|nr:helix-turn-helix domain-containing protein [Bacteroidales bacterium]
MKHSLGFCLMCAWAVLWQCSPSPRSADEKCETLLSESLSAADRQDYDAATGLAAQALDAAREAVLPRYECRSHLTLAGAGIATSRDSVAWMHAVDAENLALSGNWPDLLSQALIIKAQICSYVEVSPDFNRNDEGLGYAHEALVQAHKAGNAENEANAMYIISSLLTNKNRWNNPPEETFYREAGRYLDMADSTARAAGLEKLLRKGAQFRARYYQQGGRWEEMVDLCNAIIDSCGDNDYLSRMQAYDRLMRVLPRLGRYDEMQLCYERQNMYTQLYFRQKADETLQEIETRYETREAKRQIEKRNLQILILSLFTLLLAAGAMLVLICAREVRRRNRELENVNATKEQIIDFLSHDLRNPSNSQIETIRNLSKQAAGLTPEEIRKHCDQIARQAQTFNEDVAGYIGNLLVERSREIANVGLTHREIEIVQLCAEGLSSSEIAEKLFVSVHTVSRHRQNIYMKMGVKNVTDMIRRARELGLI